MTSDMPSAVRTRNHESLKLMSSLVPRGKRVKTAAAQVEELEWRCALSAPTVPVLFIPGFAASMPKVGDIRSFVLNRGLAPTNLNLSGAYEPLVKTLEANGYVDGQTFFGATFDWRMPVAPTDGVNDGNLRSLTAEQITTGVRTGGFPYAVDYLGFWLDQAVQAAAREHVPPPTQVDIVTHSTGGFLARSYIESPAYGGVYTDANGMSRTLPKIHDLILGADPSFGTVHSWRPWNGNFADVLSGFIPTVEISGRMTALAYRSVVRGGTVTGPGPDGAAGGGDIRRADVLETTKLGNVRPDPSTFFRLYTPLRQDLMPTFDFLVQPGASQPTNVNDRPSERSNVSLDLNGASVPGNNPWVTRITNAGGSVTVTFAPGARQTTQGVVYDFLHPGAVNENPFVDTPIQIQQTTYRRSKYLPLTSLLYPRPQNHLRSVGSSPFFMLGNREIAGPVEGDNQVPFVSGIADYESLNGKAVDPNVSIVLWGNGSPDNLALPYGPIERWTMQTRYPVLHDYFFTNLNVDSFVVSTLTGKRSPLIPDRAPALRQSTRSVV